VRVDGQCSGLEAEIEEGMGRGRGRTYRTGSRQHREKPFFESVTGHRGCQVKLSTIEGVACYWEGRAVEVSGGGEGRLLRRQCGGQCAAGDRKSGVTRCLSVE
jgi:hypothetical protein